MYTQELYALQTLYYIRNYNSASLNLDGSASIKINVCMCVTAYISQAIQLQRLHWQFLDLHKCVPQFSHW